MTPKQVLVVDDDLNTINLLSRMLERQGYAVQSTFDPFEGYRLAVENRFCLILLDIMMPNWSGFALCRELRLVDDLKNVPIYFVSAYTAVDVEDNTKNVGANGVLFKPIRMKDIMPILEVVEAKQATKDSIKHDEAKISTPSKDKDETAEASAPESETKSSNGDKADIKAIETPKSTSIDKDTEITTKTEEPKLAPKTTSNGSKSS